jgi:sugar phosphate isomerase/epimerase
MMAPGDTFREKLDNLARLGYEGVEIRLLEEEATPERLDEIEEALASSPVRACSLLLPSPAYARRLEWGEVLEVRLANARRALEIGGRLGVGTFVTPEYLPQSPLPLWYRPGPIAERHDDMELLVRLFGEALEHAEKVGATVLLEPINRYETRFCHNLADGVAVCERMGSDRLRLVADFFHLNIEEVDPAASIEAAAGHIAHVQLGDSNRELPGLGHTDFVSGFAALEKIGYEGHMALECRLPRDPERELAGCAAFLQECIAAGGRGQ